MGYVLYLVGCVLLAALAAMVNPFSSSFQLVSANLCNLVDLPTLVWVLAVCALALLGTRSVRPFGRGLRAAFRRETLPAAQARESLSAWKLVSLAALLAGGMGFLNNLFAMMHSLAFTDEVGLALNLACLALYYALFLDLLLLPVGVLLKRQLETTARNVKNDGSIQGSISLRTGRRKAG